jgi:hypothetical protein
MSLQSVEVEALLVARVGRETLATRMMAFVAGVAHKTAEEVAYMIREDLRHGLISRDPKDWER